MASHCGQTWAWWKFLLEDSVFFRPCVGFPTMSHGLDHSLFWRSPIQINAGACILSHKAEVGLNKSFWTVWIHPLVELNLNAADHFDSESCLLDVPWRNVSSFLFCLNRDKCVGGAGVYRSGELYSIQGPFLPLRVMLHFWKHDHQPPMDGIVSLRWDVWCTMEVMMMTPEAAGFPGFGLSVLRTGPESSPEHGGIWEEHKV